MLKEIRVETSTEPITNPQEALGEVKAFMMEGESYLKALEIQYQEGAISIVTFAKNMQKSVIETMAYFANTQRHRIHVCLGNEIVSQEAYNTLTKDCQVVLDDTAIATLFMLGLHKELAALPFKFIIPETAIQEIYRVIDLAVSMKDSEGSLNIVNGNLFYKKISPNEHANWIKSLDELVLSLKANCSIQGGKSLSVFDRRILI